MDEERVPQALHATTYDGRPAWRFTAPEVKGHSLELAVDDEIGLALCIENGDLGIIDSWSGVRTGPPPRDDLFTFKEHDVWATD